MGHWDKFYKEKKAPKGASSFAKFIVDFNLPGHTLVDLGSGNGRDSQLLATSYVVTAVDPSCKPKDKEKLSFIKDKWQDAREQIKKADIVYSRFFLHAIPENEVSQIIDLCRGYFVAEARAVGDVPKLYTDHERFYVNGEELLMRAISAKMEIIHYEKGYGLAKYKGEDPLIIRIIAKRK